MTVLDLISLLEAATEGSRTLDGRIHEYLGYCPHRETRYGAGDGDCMVDICIACGEDIEQSEVPPIRNYSRSVDSALSLIPEGWDWSISISGYGAARKFFGYVREVQPNWMTSDRRDAEGFCHHPHGAAMAICIAALRARQAVGEQGGGGQ